jgi:hypothetical protein
MASFWDLLPASPWSAQPDISSLPQAPAPNAPQGAIPALPPVPNPPPQPQSPPSSITSWWDEPDDFGSAPPVIAPAPAHATNPLGGILGPIFGAKPGNAAGPITQPVAPYGVVPKNFPNLPTLPLPTPDWQRPESEFAIDSPRSLANIQRSLAAGLSPGGIVVYDGHRSDRDRARAAEFLLPGSGNFVSGDWGNITDADLANLAFSLATAIPPAAEARLARAGIKVAQVASEAETMAAAVRAAEVRGYRLGGRSLTFPEQNNVLLFERAGKILSFLDPRNARLQVPMSLDQLPSLNDLHILNDEIKAIREQKGLLDLEGHHEFTRQFSPWFAERGVVDPHDYVSYMWMWDHRLRGGGLHAGPNSWNPTLRNFIHEYPYASPDQSHQQINQMLKLRQGP